ncbi:diguanylate cyclase [Desulfobacterales bacterium HSG16]|nr:diguanylate cyclase [Desulfobacterales bacterium HSG16]
MTSMDLDNGRAEAPDLNIRQEYEVQLSTSCIDALTGLANHGFFQLTLEREIHRSRRYGGTFTLALIDIDLFSLYNKENGILAGDRALKSIAGLIQENIRQSDLAARYAGDVIALILTRSSPDSCMPVVERIRKAVEKMFCGKLTVSTGLSGFFGDSDQKENLVEQACEALIQSKIKGKNRSSYFEREHQPEKAEKSTILVVDDNHINLVMTQTLLESLDYDVITADNGEEALNLIAKKDIDLILLDIVMPGMDGYEVCRRIKGSEATRMIPVIMLTSLDDNEARIQGIEAGTDDFISKPPNQPALTARIKSLINVKSLNQSLTSIENVLFSLANAVEAKDVYTQGHVQRVANLALSLGKRMELSKKEIKAIRFGGWLHDIGKIGTPVDILNKTGPLNTKEWEIMRQHPEVGYKICLPLKSNLGHALDVIRHHHEKLDGSGYPDGIKDTEVSQAARIMAVADIYDALVTDRPYRKALIRETALEILWQEAAKGKLDKDVIFHLSQLFKEGKA